MGNGRLWGLHEMFVKGQKGNKDNSKVYTIKNVSKTPDNDKLDSIFNEIRKGIRPNNSSYTDKE